MKTCVIMQPTYLPWLGYFNLIERSDVFVFLDHVQFSKQSWQQRNRIRDKSGVQLLTIPVKGKKNELLKIKDVEIDLRQIPLVKHLKSIENNYRKSKNFDVVFSNLFEIYNRNYIRLQDLNVDLILLGCRLMNIPINYKFSSSYELSGDKVEVLIDICQRENADHYLSPIGSKEYIDENNIFHLHNIQLEYQNYTPPEYKQMNYNDFISHLSFIDYLFNI